MFKQKKALSFIALLLLNIGVEAKINISASEEKQVLCQEVYKKMINEHFFNDKDLTSINSEIFDALVDQLDSQKIYFTENEIKSFKRKFSQFDNQLNINWGINSQKIVVSKKDENLLSFNQIAIMCGTSVKQIENTYLHLNEEMMRTSAKADYITLEDGTLRVI